MQVFIITDVDSHECRAFLNRKNAIDAMYYKCKEWGAILYVSIDNYGLYQFKELSKIYDTDEEKLQFLYSLCTAALNDVFEAYWHFQECEIEDEQ